MAQEASGSQLEQLKQQLAEAQENLEKAKLSVPWAAAENFGQSF